MYEFYLRNKALMDKCFFAIAFVLAVYVFIAYLFQYIAPFCVAYALSLLLEPLVRFLNRKWKIGRGIAAVFCLIVAVILIGFLGLGLFSKIWSEARAFSTSLPRYITDATLSIEKAKLGFLDYLQLIPVDFNEGFGDVGANIVTFITSFVGTGIKDGSVGFVSGIPNFFINILLCLISTFFFIKDKFFISEVINKNCPQVLIRHYHVLKKGIFDALGGYIKAQCIIMSVIAIINITGLVFMGYPYALLMGLLIALVDALPILGSGLILWPWMMLSFISANYTKAISLLVLYGVNLITRQMMEPKVLSEQIGLYPLITLVSIYAGLKVFGVLGFFIGPLIAISIKILYMSGRET